MSHLETTGILRIHGKDYTLQTYYPKGRKHPQYKMFYVWAGQESRVFASEDGFINWLGNAQAPVQQRLC